MSSPIEFRRVTITDSFDPFDLDHGCFVFFCPDCGLRIDFPRRRMDLQSPKCWCGYTWRIKVEALGERAVGAKKT